MRTTIFFLCLCVAAASPASRAAADDVEFFELVQPGGGGAIDCIGGAGIGGNERDH